MESNARKRGNNFTPEERDLLIKIANKYKNTIENKKTDGTTWKSKEAAWRQVEAAFNSCISGTPRTSKQLRTKYEGIKKEIKKKCAMNKSYRRGTGGGQYVPPPEPPNEEEKELMETIAISIHGFQNPFDCDNIQGEQLIVDTLDEITVSEEISEEIDTNWAASAFNCRMLQTPLHSALTMSETVEREERVTENHPEIIYVEGEGNFIQSPQDAGEEKENQLPAQGNKKKDWSSRRRPVLKKKCQKSVAGKFEELALKKQELINSLLENAENDKAQHQMKLRILKEQEESEQIRKTILKVELKIAQFKYNSLKQSDDASSG